MPKYPENSFLDCAEKKVLFLDGAMGTSLFAYDLSAEDYGGPELEGCPEHLNFSKPEIISEIHSKFLEAGADIIETNTFGGQKHVLAEYNLEDKSYKLAHKAAELAREQADKSSTANKPRFVAGSLGPGTKLPSLGHISYDELFESYQDEIRGLIDGGIDLLLIETSQDPLQIKATLDAAFKVFKDLEEEHKGSVFKKYPRAIQVPPKEQKTGFLGELRFPIMVQVTVETTGTLLVGSDIASALTTISAYPVDAIGMNCATGPKEMAEHIKYLCENTDLLVSCIPNAGIPENRGGVPYYPLGPEEMAKYLSRFVSDYGVNIVGGCCGTTYEHIRVIHDTLANNLGASKPIKPKEREVSLEDCASSIYNSVPMLTEPRPLIIGERTNANGSKKFKELLAAEDYEGIVELARREEAEGAHLIDLCTAYVGRDEVSDMIEAVSRLNTALQVPLMIDSTEYPVIEAALKRISGKAIINSVNLEDGEERVAQIAGLCNRYGAALVALTIDEQGMAKTAKHKFEVAERLYDLLVNKHGMKPGDIIFDTLTFTLGSGDEEFRKAGIETIEAIRLIKEKYPECKTVLGVSNISFGLDRKLRPPLNSVFIAQAIKAGLDMVIANSKKIIPLNKLDPELRKHCEALINDDRTFKADGEAKYDPLIALIDCAQDIKIESSTKKNPYEGLEIEEILERRIVDGNKNNIEVDLDLALAKGHKALDIINGFLMAGMKTVGELFGAGEMQLPFVLQSATTMKAAVAYLETFMDKEDSGKSKGSIVLATVKGDVHDIGKNLVDIILSNNGYTVHNLGIKQPIEEILKAVEEHKPDVIGMSGLLVKSTLIMKQNLELMEERGYSIPVILGGAALTKKFVEEDCQNAYSGKVFYGFDAFTDLKILNQIISGDFDSIKREPRYAPEENIESAPDSEAVYQEVQDIIKSSPKASSKPDPFKFQDKISSTSILKPKKLPKLPFYGKRILKPNEIDLEEIWKYLNLDALIIGQWQFRKAKTSDDDYQKKLESEIYPALEKLKKSALDESWLQPSIAYGYYYCKVNDKNPNLLEIYDESKSKVIESFEFPRQTNGEHLCLSDYFKLDPIKDGFNIVALQAVTVGHCASEHAQKLYDSGDFQSYLYAHGLSVETTEALAEYAHAKIREELGISTEDSKDIKKLIKGDYHGMRYSFGYPACPKLEDQAQLFRLLKAEEINMELSEEWQIHPEQSTSAIVIHHPEAKYFNVK